MGWKTRYRTPRNPRQRGLMVLWLLVSGMWCGCAEDHRDPIRIGLNPWPGYDLFYLASEKGFFEDEGVSVRVLEYSSLSDTRRAFEQGQVDGMGCSLVELIQSRYNTKRSPQAFLVTDFSAGADVILSQSSIRDIAGLRGRRVGVELGSLSVFLLSRGLAQAGLTLEDVQLVPVNPLNMAQALRDGAVDAVATYPPISTKILSAGQARTLFTSAQIPGEIIDVIALDQPILQSRPREVTGIIRAWGRSLRFVEQHPDEAHRIMAERERITVDQFREALAGVQLVTCQQQRALFEAGGGLTQTAIAIDQLLRETGQVRGSSRQACCLVSTAIIDHAQHH